MEFIPNSWRQPYVEQNNQRFLQWIRQANRFLVLSGSLSQIRDSRVFGVTVTVTDFETVYKIHMEKKGIYTFFIKPIWLEIKN